MESFQVGNFKVRQQAWVTADEVGNASQSWESHGTAKKNKSSLFKKADPVKIGARVGSFCTAPSVRINGGN